MSHDAARWDPTPTPPGHQHDWTRVYRRHGHEAHIRELIYSAHPRASWNDDGWFGTGSQEEYERAAQLPLCPKCFVILDLYEEENPERGKGR